MVIAFRWFSTHGCFRKPYTTTSSETFLFPPPTAVVGVISAILGFDNGSSRNASAAGYWDKIKDTGTQIAIKINKPSPTMSVTSNFLFLDTGKGALHTQIKQTYLKRPDFTVFLKNSCLEDMLDNHLSNERYEFLPKMGQAKLFAQIEYLGREEEKSLVPNAAHEINTLLPLPFDELEGERPKLVSIRRVKAEIVPMELDTQRTVQKTIRVLIPDGTQGSKITISNNNGYFDISNCFGNNVAWFPAW